MQTVNLMRMILFRVSVDQVRFKVHLEVTEALSQVEPKEKMTAQISYGSVSTRISNKILVKKSSETNKCNVTLGRPGNRHSQKLLYQ